MREIPHRDSTLRPSSPKRVEPRCFNFIYFFISSCLLISIGWLPTLNLTILWTLHHAVSTTGSTQTQEHSLISLLIQRNQCDYTQPASPVCKLLGKVALKISLSSLSLFIPFIYPFIYLSPFRSEHFLCDVNTMTLSYEAYSDSKYRFAVKKNRVRFRIKFYCYQILQTIFPHIRCHY